MNSPKNSLVKTQEEEEGAGDKDEDTFKEYPSLCTAPKISQEKSTQNIKITLKSGFQMFFISNFSLKTKM